jgi:tRNA threonylcarbamoyladenosine biosynthesis protein TsaE
MQLFKRNFKLSEIDSIAEWILQSEPISHIICFEGELGAGKTTLIKAVCRKLGVKDNVSSPTYSLLNVYQTGESNKFQEVIHIDLYRLSGEEEAMRAGLEEYIFSGNYCLIEWPQRAPGILPEHYLRVRLKFVNGDERMIELCSE